MAIMNSRASWRLPGCATGLRSSPAAIWFSRSSVRGRSRPARSTRILVLRAARALAAHFSGVKLGRFRLVKRLPAAAGLGGGSADAAAALRLLADEARLSVDDPRVRAAATATGADVLACLRPQARMMTGVGDQLGPLIPLPKMFAVLVNPQVQAPTPKVFAALGLARGSTLEIIRQFVRWAGKRYGGHPGFSRLEPKRPGSGGGRHSAGNRRRAREIGADPGGHRDGNVRIGSDLLCLVRRSPQCDASAAHCRRRTPGLVGRGDRHPLVRRIATIRNAFVPHSQERAAPRTVPSQRGASHDIDLHARQSRASRRD